MTAKFCRPSDKPTEQLALEDFFRFLRRDPSKIILIGPLTLWLRGGYNLRQMEAFLDRLVEAGILRYATEQELKAAALRHGYKLTPEGMARLPASSMP